MSEETLIWQAQPGPQSLLIACPVFEVFYGGARGGGKTEGSLGDWMEHLSTWGPAANGIFLRRTAKQLEEVVARSLRLFPKIGGKFRESPYPEWRWSNGARLKFRYLERDRDAEEYQGHSYSRVYIEEVPNFPSPSPIDMMRATIRSAEGAHCGMRLTGNPGGPGHTWVKKRYIDPAPQGFKVIKEAFKNPFTKEIMELERVFIPSKLSDNPLLMQNDPFYVGRLQQQASEKLVEAWLMGNWDIVLGAFFDEFDSRRHVLSTAEWLPVIPKEARRFRAFDWGSAAPFSVGWYAVSDGSWGLPRNALVKYREWYGASGPGKGLKLDAETVALEILRRERGEFVEYGVADPQIFVRDGGPSIAERMALRGCLWIAGDRRRKAGWDALRHALKGDGDMPLLYFLDQCTDTVRTLPVLPHDEHDDEDIDTDSEDHAGDETRYAVMSRPQLSNPKAESRPTPGTMGYMVAEHLRQRKQERSEVE